MTKHILQYLKLQEEWSKKYGSNTVVLMEVGTFYEIYEYDPYKDKNNKNKWPVRKIGKATELASLLNITLTQSDKSKPYSLSNPNIIGFPKVAFDKYRDEILMNNFTIVLVHQFGSSPNIVRKVANIISPATHAINENTNNRISNNITCLYIEVTKIQPKIEDCLTVIGLSTMDCTTGENSVAEVYSSETDSLKSLQEVYRFLLSINPREIVIYFNLSKLHGKHNNTLITDKDYKKWLSEQLHLSDYSMVIVRDEINKEYLKTNYQQQFFTKVFSNIRNNNTQNNQNNQILIDQTIIERLGLERLLWGTVSYIGLLDYCYEHNETLINRINYPETGWVNQTKHLIITHNAIEQLDIVGKSNNNNKNSLINTLNKTSTVMGKRFLIQMLTNPITDEERLNRFYNATEELVKDQDYMSCIEQELKTIPDLERYQRKLQLKIISPYEFCTLFKAYTSVVRLFTTIWQKDTSMKWLLFNEVQEFNQCLSQVMSKYNLDNLAAANIINNDGKKQLQCKKAILYPQIDQKADRLAAQIQLLSEQIINIVDYLNEFLQGTRGKKLFYDLTEMTGSQANSKASKLEGRTSLVTTPTKAKKLKSQLNNIDPAICGELHFINSNKRVNITSDKITEILTQLIELREESASYYYSLYMETLSEISGYAFFRSINRFVKQLDYIKSNAKNAIKWSYHKPKIDNSDSNNTSWFKCADIRHPIVERLINTEYITNNVQFSHGYPHGMLLYGSNSVGKSTIAKAIGLNIIMAQAGMFVPGKLIYKPYNRIITRLSGEDQIMQGKSSFVVEMTELRTILRNSDENTLVLGDELSRGTESISGTALTITTLTTLVKRKSSFIFSTHMHHLVDNHRIKTLVQNKELTVKHLVLRYDPESKSLIYDRKLKDGSGDSIYGLEVAMSLSLPQEFISEALIVRKEVVGKNKTLLSAKRSKYSKDIYMDHCLACQKDIAMTELDTHHIREQAEADANGMIKHFHKNRSFNLVTLCKTCHQKLHLKGLKIQTSETSHGNVISIPSL